ncbi:MAG TPA: lanthionine synthetase C family protein [Flavobacteriales bacterium]|nr:lanthionine synthetase C family protein [Flavobacteriales bacterium]
MDWIPLFHKPKEKKKIVDLIVSIGDTLPKSKIEAPGLLVGNSGISIFYAYLYLLTKKYSYKKISKELIGKALMEISKSELSGSFAEGICGICWSYKYQIDNKLIKANYEDTISEEINEYLAKHASFNFKNGHYDFLYGGLGSALFLLNFKNVNFINSSLQEYVLTLKEISTKDSNGIAWIDKAIINYKSYNLGLSHGIPSIIFVLCKAIENNINTNDSCTLLNKSIKWLLDKQKYSDFPSCFPEEFINKTTKGSSGLRWCYGDLGIASVLYHAGKITGNNKWIDEAIRIMLHASKRKDLEPHQVLDACFCHGSVGIAHIFNRFYQVTKIEEFKIAAKYWYLQTLSFSKIDQENMGFKTSRLDEFGKKYTTYEYGILQGSAGIGLALISAISAIEPKWDKCLLLS